MLGKLVRPLGQRVRLMVTRAVVELVNDAATMQAVQVSLRADELRDGVERFQNYGFSSVPAPGAEGVALAVGGDSGHCVLVAVDDRRYRITDMAEGEVCLYTLGNGRRLYLKEDGQVHLGTDPTDFVALAPNTESRLAALEAAIYTHTHPFVAVVAGGVAAVTGVSAGPPATLNVPAAPVAATEVKAK
jgi:phage baseplate assembly protein V